ncbi:hypothetical protein RND81_03G072100 [Saponaria officinalis]|uniref:Glycolipid transfer protein domain-containing protein n=1 Tax=Saponaria officinalis TaxID=3572 RepID=A0AAW1M6D6_SAPOF
MKRKREIERKTEIKSAIEELSLIIKFNNNNNHKNNNTKIMGSSSNTSSSTLDNNTSNNKEDDCFQQVVVSKIPTRPFISLCSSILQVLDKIGPTMAVLRQDIFKNIQRLEMLYETNPEKYSYLVDILNKEAVDRNAKKGDTSSKALVWLTRCLDFTAALLQRLIIDPKESMEQIVGDAYEITFKPWHGWIAAAAFRVALKLIPDTDTFINLLKDKDHNFDTLKDDIQSFLSLLVPLLEDLHSTLSSYGLEKLKSA